MLRVAVNMRNLLLGQVLEKALRGSGEFYTTVVADPEDVAERCELVGPDILLMEVAGSPPWSLAERMQIRNDVKRSSQRCKVVLLVDEYAEKQTAEQIKQAKRDGLIDQFVYGSSSASFLMALMETL